MIEKNGFLSSDMDAWKAKHRSENEILFQLCEKLNEFSHQTMLSLKVTNTNLTEILSVCSCVRAMSNFQSIVILAEYGLINEAKIILRSMVEAMFLMVAIDKDNYFSVKILDQDMFDQIMTAQTLKRNIIAGILKLDTPTLEEIDQKIAGLKKQIKDSGIRKMHKSDLAMAANLTSYYDTIYHVLCGTVHINPRDLEQYLDLNEKGVVKEILWGPDIDKIEDVLFAAVETMVFVMQSLSHLFQLAYDDNWNSIHEEYMKFGQQATA